MGYISLTGNPITFTANRVNTINSLVLNGQTTQSGTGDPSPTNIRPIFGVGEYRSNGYYTDIVVTTNGVPKTYTIGPMNSPLYDGDVLTWSGGSTVEIVRNRTLSTVTGNENITTSALGELYLTRVTGEWHLSLLSRGKSACSVSNKPVANYGNVNGAFNYAGNQIQFFSNNPNAFSRENLKLWYQNKTPAQVLSFLDNPTTETVPISEPITNAAGTVTLSAENTMNVTYFQLEVSNNKYQDIQLSDNTLLIQFEQAWSNGDYATAFNIIDNNPQLDTKSFVADVINTLTANLTYLQNLNDPTFKADRIQTSATPPVDLQVGQVYFKTL